MPSETSRPASPMVISVTTNVPVWVPNQAAPDGSLNDHLRQHGAVDRRPQPEDEPPAGGGHHEADPAAEDPGLPDVVAARPGDRDHQPAVGAHQDRHPHTGAEHP